MRKVRKKIKIEFICDKCGYTSEDEEEFLRVGNFDLCWVCFEEYEKFIETFKGQTIEDFIFEEK
jgi:formylmethanofuran dehydrogenase subunit E